jgi:hypothetical protein
MTKYKLLLLLSLLIAARAEGQLHGASFGGTTSQLPAANIALNVATGVWGQQYKAEDLLLKYADHVNSNVSDIKFGNGIFYSGSLQLGYFFGHARSFGIGSGISLARHNGKLTVENFHVEYKAIDFNNEVFRQVVHAGMPIEEELSVTNISIPLVLKYQTFFENKLGIQLDAGIVLNLKNSTTYTSNAIFDYEAVYKYVVNGQTLSAIYDQSSEPGPTNWMISRRHYARTQPEGDIAAYFDSRRKEGYNVGLDVRAAAPAGKVELKTGIGYQVQPGVCYLINERMVASLNFLFLWQSYSNENGSTRLTDKVGSYSALINNIKEGRSTLYGIGLGIRYNF